MDQQDLFNYYQNFEIRPQRINTSKNAALNPWGENQLINPYLNVKEKKPNLASNSVSLKKLQTRQKSKSMNQSKSTNHLPILLSRESTDTNKISKKLPKLNIGQKSVKSQVIKKKKITQQFAKRFVLNSSPLFFSSPTANNHSPVHTSQDLAKKSKVFPAVSRQLDVTRKIYLLQNKFASSASVSPQKRSKFFGRQEGDIRRLVEKEWAKKM